MTMFAKRPRSLVLLACWGFLACGSPLSAVDPAPWSAKDTRLAGEYLNLLVEKPEDGAVLNLLWKLYEKHQATDFLLESITAQVKAQPHPSVILIYAHLLRKAGKVEEAAARYQEVLKADEGNLIALRARAELADEAGQPAMALELLQKLSGKLPAGDPQIVPLLLEQGRLSLAAGKPNEAAAAWEQAAKLQPENTAVLRDVAQRLLGAGFLDKALALYQLLARTPDPAKRLDALLDLARLEEQADHFEPAAEALRQGLGLLHFKDWRYAQFFQRLVRLHERFGQLDPLKTDLTKAAQTSPPQEKALADMVRYSALTVDADEHLRWLKELVRDFPDAMDYRWQLVSTLLDHDDWHEAAELVDSQLKNDGTDLPALVQLRCLAHLRAGEPDMAAARLRQLLETQGGSLEVEQQVLAFAREKALDEIVERILRARVARDADKAEAVFDLASYLVKRQRLGDARKALDAYATRPGLGTEDSQRRLQEVAGFLIGSQQSQAAEEVARVAVGQGAQRESLIQLADVLSQRGDHEAALPLLERAWAQSDSTDKRTDVDEMILSILSGETGQRASDPMEPSGEFTLPAIFTGEGFGTDAPPEATRKGVAEAVVEQALRHVLIARGVEPRKIRDAPLLPGWVRSWLRPVFAPLDRLPPPSAERIYRAAWWCIRADLLQTAYDLLGRLHFDERHHWQPASVEVEKLLLELALTDQNTALALRQLRLLATLDPDNRFAHLLRLAEIEGKRENQRGLAQAIGILEQLQKEDPQNEAVLSALAPLYVEAGRREEALTLWEKAAANARGNAAPLLERYAEVLVAQRKFREFIDIQMRLLEGESDVKRRREIFGRAMERLLWADIVQGSLPDDEAKMRLGLLHSALQERSRRAPFDGFWHEALAQVYERQDEAAKAFAEMKQAYYTAPDTPFSLDQLRAAALRVGDLKSAIYFQKQVAAAAAARDGAGEWRKLVELLEQDFRMGEADQARRRLEARFSQDSAALEDLARYYSETGQDEAARRVQEQMARVRSWDMKNLLRLALQQKHLGDVKAARQTLVKILAASPAPAPLVEGTPPEKLPWPLLDGKKGAAGVPAAMLAALDNAPGLEQPERDRLRGFLATPRGEFSEVPEETSHVRLRAMEELAGMDPGEARRMIAENGPGLSQMERAWGLYHGGDGEGFLTFLARRLGTADSLELRFLRVWLGLRAHGLRETLAWVRQGRGDAQLQSRKGLFQAVANILADDENFDFTVEDVTALGDARLFSNTELIDLARKLEARQRYEPALTLRMLALANDPTPELVDILFIAQLAETMGRTDLQKAYLEMAWRTPLKAGPPQAFDPFLFSLSRLMRLVETPADRERLMRESWKRLGGLPASGQGTLRQALLLGIAGAEGPAGDRLTSYFSNGFLASQAFVEPILGGRLPPGAPAPGPRIDELNHLRHYWDDLREWGELIRQEGLAVPMLAVDREIAWRHGGVPMGPKSNYEYGMWRNMTLVREMRFATYPERLRLVREFLEVDDEVETLTEVGPFLESQGFARECMEIYGRLPERAPSNVEYCEQYLRVAEQAWECTKPLAYIEKVFVAEPQFKPQNLAEGLLEEKHARFLARLHDVGRLRLLAFRGVSSVRPMTGRVPEEMPYLRELGMLLERMDDKPGALAAWEQLHGIWPQDGEAALRAARILVAQGNKTRALELLRTADYSNLWNDPVRETLVLRVRLAAESGLWDEVREIMNLVTGAGGSKTGTLPYTASVVAVSRELVAQNRSADAQNLLLRAERAAKDAYDRFRLRLEQLKIVAADPTWDPVRDASRLRSLLLADLHDADALEDLTAFLTAEAAGPRADAWVALLRGGANPGTAATLALCSFASRLEEKDLPLLIRPWLVGSRTRNDALQSLAARTLLQQKRPRWAWQVALAGPGRPLTVDPVLVPVLAALKDRHGMDELFSRLVRLSFPGGGDVTGFVEAFVEAGRDDLAEELAGLALERLRATGSTLPKLVAGHVRHLIKRHRFEEAETLLLAEHQSMVEGVPELLMELYGGWNKLDRLPRELAKFHLPDGLLSEVLFLNEGYPPASP